jgi:hypothetical protein
MAHPKSAWSRSRIRGGTGKRRSGRASPYDVEIQPHFHQFSLKGSAYDIGLDDYEHIFLIDF